MNIILILQIVFAISTAIIGLLAFLRPEAIQGFTGLNFSGARGKVEIRAIFGGAFIAMGIAPFLLGQPGYQALGIIYLGIGIARVIGTLVDRSTENSNIVSLMIEIVFGVILLL